MYYGEP